MSQPPNSQHTSNSVQAALKTQSIKVLRGTINLLEGLVTKLEAVPEASISTNSIWNRLQRRWSQFLARIRKFLPALARISDTGLTSIIAAIAVGLVATTILSNQLANVPVAIQPVAQAPTSEVPIVEPAPDIASTAELPIEETSPPEALPEPAVSIPVEEPATSEITTHDTEAIAPKEEPAPELELTPEQTLIAAIEKQVAQISNSEGDGIIQAIQANFPASSLTVTVAPTWYNLNPPQQDKLAAQILQRAQDLDFIHLEVVDPQNKLLARSPVVGNNMVILKRQAP